MNEMQEANKAGKHKQHIRRGRRIEVFYKPSMLKNSEELGPKDVILRIHSSGNEKFEDDRIPPTTLRQAPPSRDKNNEPVAVKEKDEDEQSMTVKQRKSLIWRKRRKKLISVCKRVLGFLLSTLGLFILLISYTILGGWVFNMVESPKEMRTKHSVRDSLRQHIELLWNTTEQLNVLHKENWSEMATSIVERYTRVVYLATKNEGWDGKNDGESDLQWSFAGSLLYSVTVITTIGKLIPLYSILIVTATLLLYC